MTVSLAPLSDATLKRLGDRLIALRSEFTAAVPFPHVVIDDVFDPAIAAAVADEFARPDLPWKHYHHVNEKKRVASELANFGPTSQAVVRGLHSPVILRALEQLIGVDGLLPDPDLDGAGLQETLAGGFLNMHADHLAHAKRQTWSRQVNLLLYLSPGWRDEYGGALELWDPEARRCVRRITPLFNRAVIFRTTRTSIHGVPEGIQCPAGQSRKSIALYFFRDEGQTCPLVPTRYLPRPTDSRLQRVLIRLDGALVGAYTRLKRHTPLGDRVVARWLRYF
jgi:Rps23 Pro-64 3,4-dihydroxylase Tpa1-like proline 4-hydroxylase